MSSSEDQIKISDQELESATICKTKENGLTNNIPCTLHDILDNIQIDCNTIFELDLSACEITTLPKKIERLTYLKNLNLSCNKLKEIPIPLYTSLDYLEVLDLSHNLLEKFEVQPACYNNIRILKLNNNKIANLPRWILNGVARNLEELNYSCNAVSNLKTAHQVYLKKFEICNAFLLNEDLAFFKQIRTLEYLDISNIKDCSYRLNNFRNIDDLFIMPKWKCMNILKLNNLLLSIIPEGIFWISTLTELHLINCGLSWIQQDVQYLSKLELLDVSNNNICAIPDELAELKYLKILKAPNNNISKVPSVFKSCLQIIDLYDNYLDDFPDDLISEIDFIDLELNHFEVHSFDSYSQKLKRFRDDFDLNERTSGMRPELKSSSSSSESSTCSTYSDFSEDDAENQQVNSIQSDHESWDLEEVSPKIHKPRNPDITSSDDEWQANEEDFSRKANQISLNGDYVDYDEVIFCDVD